MKKAFKTAILSLAIMPFIAGCQQSPSVDITKIAQEVSDIVGVSYAGYASTSGITLAGDLLITEYTHDGYKFGLEYTVAPFSETANYVHDYLTIKDGNQLVVKIPTFAELNPGLEEDQNPTVTYARYILKADFKYLGVAEGEETLTGKVGTVVLQDSWNIRINAEKVEPIWERIVDARNKNSGETVVTSGYVAAFMNNVDSGEFSNGVWIADGSYGMMLYRGNLDGFFSSLKIGDLVFVIGTASPYNGLFEIKPSTIQVVATSPEPVAQPTFREVDEAEIKAMTFKNTNELISIPNCTITTDLDKLETTGAMSIDVKFGSTTWTAYVNKHTNEAHREELLAHLKEHQGQPFTLKTLISAGNNKLQFGISIFGNDQTLVENFVF